MPSWWLSGSLRSGAGHSPRRCLLRRTVPCDLAWPPCRGLSVFRGVPAAEPSLCGRSSNGALRPGSVRILSLCRASGECPVVIDGNCDYSILCVPVLAPALLAGLRCGPWRCQFRSGPVVRVRCFLNLVCCCPSCRHSCLAAGLVRSSRVPRCLAWTGEAPKVIHEGGNPH